MFVRDGLPDWYTEVWGAWYATRFILRDFSGLLMLALLIVLFNTYVMLLSRGHIPGGLRFRHFVSRIAVVGFALIPLVYLFLQITLIASCRPRAAR